MSGARLPNLGSPDGIGNGRFFVYLDLHVPKDIKTLRGLVREADMFRKAYRPGTLGDRGFSPEALVR
jgi:crotonobetainyl-CoA:carnitine CoA-transferase CaiB-like acyl-CoA transferase